MRKVSATKGEFVEVSDHKQTISYSDKYRKNISSDIKIPPRTKSDFIVRFILEKPCEVYNSYIYRQHRKDKKKMLISYTDSFQKCYPQHKEK